MFAPTNYFQEVAATLTAIPAAPVERIIDALRQARDHGHRIFTCGNGGSRPTRRTSSTICVKSTIAPGRPRCKADLPRATTLPP